MALSRRWTAATVVLVAGIAGAFVIVPDPPQVLTVSPEQGAADHTSIQAAVDALGPRGGTVEVQAGRYAERVVLEDRRGVSVRARTGDQVVLDGSGLTPPDGLSGLLEVRGGARVLVAGLELTGYRSSTGGAVPAGVVVRGGVDGVTVQDVDVHGIGAGVPQGAGEARAYGVVVRGDERRAMTDLLVTGATVHDLTLGVGAAVSVSGNVADWEVSDNEINRVDHTAISALGWTEAEGGLAVDRDLTRARNGTIAGNAVADVTGGANPALGPEGCTCAAGIHVDGVLEVTVRENTVDGADSGILVGTDDDQKPTEGVDVLDNVVLGASAGSLSVGGLEEGGRVDRVLVRGNTLEGAGALPLISLQARLADVRVTNNTVTRTAGGGPLVQTQGAAVVLDYNSYVAEHPLFLEGERELTSLRDWRLRTRQDGDSTLEAPSAP